MTLLQTAKQYRDSGLSIIGCSRKRANTEWTPFKTRLPSDSEIEQMFISYQSPQIAIICGQVSGGLEVIDVDTKNDPTGALWDTLLSDLLDYFNSYMPLLITQTASGGMHLYYRCETVGGNQKLASRKDDNKTLTVIETRGEGGYVIAPPSPDYKLITTDGDLATGIPTITPDVRNDILDICRKYNQVFKVENKKSSSSSATIYRETPWDHYNTDENDPWRDVLITNGWTLTDKDGIREYWQRPGSENKWSATWNPELRLFYVFTTSSEFESEKAYSPFAIYAVLTCSGNFSEATKQLRADGYGKPFTDGEKLLIARAASFAEEQLTYTDIYNRLTSLYADEMDEELRDLSKDQKEKKIAAELPAIVEAGIKKAQSKSGMFWFINSKGKISLSYIDFAEFLTLQGFYILKEDSLSLAHRIIKINRAEHLIYEVSIAMVKEFLVEWVNANEHDLDVGRKSLLNALILQANLSNTLDWISTISMTDIKFLRDTDTEVFLPFKNGIIHITTEDINLMPYTDLPDNVYLWANQIKSRDIELIPILNEIDFNRTPIYRFLKRLSGITPDIEDVPLTDLIKSHPDKVNSFRSFLSTLGYCMTNYKNPAKPYSIWIGEDTDDSDKGGGAGKTLYFRIAGQVRVVKILPGKTWNPLSTFAYQEIKLGTDMVVVEDVPPNFKLELMYNVITEGMVIERKNRDALTIPYEFSPKIGFTGNYNPDQKAEHARRRVRELLATKYFTDDNPPDKELGGLFFGPSWSNTDWQMFFNLCFYCIRTYLRNGIIRFTLTNNVKAKDVKGKYTKEFFSFMHKFVQENKGKWVAKPDMYDDFLNDSAQKDKDYSAKRFNNACEFYASTFGYEMHQKRASKGSGRDKQFCIFIAQGESVPEMVLNDQPF